MKYEIKIFGKDQCIGFSKNIIGNDCIIISINDTGHNTLLHKNSKIKDVLSLEFDDITLKEHGVKDGLKLFKKSHAIKIKEFVDKYKNDINTIVVHCTAGIARSGSVGCCLARYLNGEDDYLLKTGKYIPNQRVYFVLCEVLGLECTKKIFKEKLRLRNKGNRNNLKGYGNYGIYLDDMFDIVIEK